MSLNELATATKYNVPMVILIMNNGVLGMIRQWQTLFFDKHYSNSILDRKSDFVKIAEAFGAEGTKVTSLEELKTAFDNAFRCDGPYVIDCIVDKDEVVLPMMAPGSSMNEIITEVENDI